jgi:hypothetical protein
MQKVPFDKKKHHWIKFLKLREESPPAEQRVTLKLTADS